MSGILGRIRVGGALVSVLAIVSACATPGSTTGPTATAAATGAGASPSALPTEAPAPATIRLGTNWITPQADHSGIVAAIVLGYYEEENLTVEVQWLQGSALAVQQAGAGGVDLGMAGSDTILGGLSEDLPIVVVANVMQKTPTGVVYPGSASYSTFADFAGTRIATSQVGPEAPTLISRLQEAGLDPDSDVELVYVDPQAKCTTMLTGGADACTGFNTFQLLQVRQEDPGADFLSFSTPERPLLGHSIVANTEYLEQNADVVRRFLRATARGYAAADEDFGKAADYVLEVNPDSGDHEFLRQAIEVMHTDLLHSERTDQHGWGWMEDAPWQNLQSLLLSGDVIRNETPVDEIYTNEYLSEDVDF
jgi:ABC-type nitrate/sulfonate/bicarbonate transport system substrate-binding protein